MRKLSQFVTCYEVKTPTGKKKYITPADLIQCDFRIPYGKGKSFKPKKFKPAPMMKCVRKAISIRDPLYVSANIKDFLKQISFKIKEILHKMKFDSDIEDILNNLQRKIEREEQLTINEEKFTAQLKKAFETDNAQQITYIVNRFAEEQLEPTKKVLDFDMENFKQFGSIKSLLKSV